MIRPTPDTLPGRCLSAIVADPGALTAEGLAARLLPYAPPPVAPPSPAWARLGLAPRHTASTASARAAHLAQSTREVARALSRLTEAGYLAPAGDVVALHPASAALLTARGLPALLDLALPAVEDPDEKPDRWASKKERNKAKADSFAKVARAEALLRALAAGPTTYRAILGTHPGGATKAAYRALADALVIVIPSHRRPTESGIALALGWKS